MPTPARRTLVRVLFLSAAACLVCLALYSARGRAATNITVNSTSDAAANDGLCTLREAVTAANTDAASGAAAGECPAGSGTDTISFNLPGAGPHTIQLTSALPDLSTNMTVTGPGASQLTVRRSAAGGTPLFRIFTVTETVTISGLTISGGNVIGDYGGGINNGGTLTLTNSTVSGNYAQFGGGGIGNGGTLTLTNSTVNGNRAEGGGGGIDNSYALTLTNSTVNNNEAPFGGGVYSYITTVGGSLTLMNSTVSNNKADFGGGIYALGTFALTNSIVSDNKILDSNSAKGGGIYIEDFPFDVPRTVTNSTVSGNNSGEGGGIYNLETLTLTNSTVSGNSTGGFGGGINNQGLLTVTSSTVTGNSTDSVAGGIYNEGTATLRNSIVAKNTATLGRPDLNGATSQGYNLIGNDTHGGVTPTTGDQIGTPASPIEPLLGPLADNGGPTQTHALLAGSPAIDRGDDGSATPTADQRGRPRPQDDPATANPSPQPGDLSDIGAFEVRPNAAPAAVAPTPAPSTDEDTPVVITLTGTDADDDDLTFLVPTTPPGNGSLGALSAPDCSAEGVCTSTVTYTPAGNFSGTDSFKFRVSDGTAESEEATVTITVRPDGDEDGVPDERDACPGTGAGTTVNAAGCPAGQCFPAPANMAAWLPGDGNANDISGNNNNGTFQGDDGAGDPEFSAGRVGQAFDLDGTNDFVEIPDSAALSITGEISVDAWINPDQFTGTIASKYDSSGGGDVSWVFLILNTGQLRFTVSGDQSGTTFRAVDTTNPVVTTGVFQHVAATFDPTTQQMRIYVNGAEAPTTLVGGSSSVTSIHDGSEPVRIGTFVNGTGQFDSIFDGLVDEVEIFSRALSQPEINAIYLAGSAGKCTTASYVVNSTADPGTGVCDATECTLREAISAANADPLAANITFQIPTTDPGYNSSADRYTITLNTALPELASGMTITGLGANRLTVRRGPSAARFRVFTVSNNASVTLAGMTVSGGHTADGTAGGFSNAAGVGGGGIFNAAGATLNLASVVVTGNRTGNGLSTTNFNGSGGAGGAGGGVFNAGTLNAAGSTFSGNTTGSGGSASGGNNGGGEGGRGGGVFNAAGATLTLTNVTVADNTAGGGGGVSLGTNITGGKGGAGGGVFNAGALNAAGSTFSGNAAGHGGNAGAGGGAHNVTGGDGGDGGAIFNDSTATLTLANSTLSGNAAGGGGDAAGTNARGGSGGFGGGIRNNVGTLALTSSTVTDNTTGAAGSGGFPFSANGGGIYGIGTANALRNSIVAGNRTAPGGFGPDINGQFQSQGYNLIGDGSTASITPTTGDQFGTSGAPINPLLGPLADNGGATRTHALLAGSPAIDRGDDGSTSPTADQRGQPRPADLDDATYPDTSDASDIGAFEAQSAPALGSTPPEVASVVRVGGPNAAAGSAVQFTVTFSEAVTGVDPTDFALTTTGTISGAAITEVTPTPGPAQSYTVTVSLGTGTGTLRLDVVDNNSILDGTNVPLGGAAAGDGNFAAGEAFTILPALTIDESQAVGAEGNTGTTTLTFTVRLSDPAPSPVTFDITTEDGSATAADDPAEDDDNDYEAKSVTGAAIAQGQTSYTFTVEVNGDAAQEGDEEFRVVVSNVAGAVATESQDTGRILNDDGAPAAGEIVISEFRQRGPGALPERLAAKGAAQPAAFEDDPSAYDEFVELYNNTDREIVVADARPTAEADSGWALVSSDDPSTPKFVVPAGTTIPARGHFLAVNLGYSLGSYSDGADINYGTDIPDGAGLMLVRTANLAAAADADRLDSVGFAEGPPSGAAASALTPAFSEGTTLQPAGGVTSPAEHSFFRRLTSGRPQDTGDNAADFQFVSADGGQYDGAQSVLGAPGPQNLSSPRQRNGAIKASLIDGMVPYSAPPNTVRKADCPPSDAAAPASSAEECDPNRSQLGTFSLRRRWTNMTGLPVTRLRFRIVDVTTLHSAGYSPGTAQADLRALTSQDVQGVEVTGGSDTITVYGTTLEQPPTQDLGGGLNVTLAAGMAHLGGTLAPSQSIDLQFLLGVQRAGFYRFFVNVEAVTEEPPPGSPSERSKSGRARAKAAKPAAKP